MKKTLLLILVLLLCISQVSAYDNITYGLQAWFSFEADTVDGTNVSDETENYWGTLINSPNVTYDGRIGTYSAYFDSSGSERLRLDSANYAWLVSQSATTFTYVSWDLPTDNSYYGGMDDNLGSNPGKTGWRGAQDGVSHCWTAGCSSFYSGFDDWDDGEWHHKVIQHKAGDTWEIFYDGTQYWDSATTKDFANGDDNWVWGQHTWNDAIYGTGAVDDVAWWNRSLMDAEIRWLSAGGTYGESPIYIDACDTLDVAGATYIMNASITDSSTDNCMDITADDIILDCNGYTIDGNDVADSGIRISRVYANANVTVQHCTLTDWDTQAIYIYQTGDNNMKELTLSSNPDNGITFYNAGSYNTIDNVDITGSAVQAISVSGGSWYISYMDITNSVLNDNGRGVSINVGSRVTITNVTANNNSAEGFYFSSVDHLNMTNIEAKNNTLHDIWGLWSSDDCDGFYLLDATGTGDLPLVGLGPDNASITYEDTEVAELIVCGADHAIINNVTITGNSNNGLFAHDCTNVTFTNILINQTYSGLDLHIFLNGSVSNTRIYDVGTLKIASSDYTTYNNITMISDDATFNDIYVSLYNSWENIIVNSTFSATDALTLSLYRGVDNIVYDNTFVGDIAINYGESGVVSNNLLYNNLFNTSDSYPDVSIFITESHNNWNTTEQVGTTIYGPGSNIGGNFWANSAGTGYSQSCTDSETDGFCDSPYNLTSGTACSGASCDANTTDYLPLSNAYAYTNPNVTLNSPANSSTGQALSTVLNVSAVVHSGTANITFYQLVDYCYQETATTTTTCGGLDTGAYSKTADFTSQTWGVFNINYTKPLGATNESKWLVKYGIVDPTNITIPQACWDQSPLQFRGNATHGSINLSCYNGTAWEQLAFSSGGTSSHSGGVVCGNKMWDGNWIDNPCHWYSQYWLLPADTNNVYGEMYEDAMYWRLDNGVEIGNVTGVSDGGIANITWSGLSPHTTYYWYVNIDDGTNNTNSSVWNFDTANTVPNATLNTPANGATSQNLSVVLNVTYIDEDLDTGNITFHIYNTTNGDCYQETANESTACGGLSTGTYSDNGLWADESLVRDGDWDTYSQDAIPTSPYPFMNITYTKPVGAENTSVWQIKDFGARTNLTIPSSCWDYNSTHLFLDVDSKSTSSYRCYWRCRNSTGWQVLREAYGGIDSDYQRAYEEGMWWDINSSLGSVTGLSNGSFANMTWGGLSYDTTYYWFVNVTDGINSVVSDTWNFTTIHAPPNVTLNSPSNTSQISGLSTVLNVTAIVYSGTADLTFYQQSEEYCYQESANESTACGGVSSGTYSHNGLWDNVSKLWDGDWGLWSYAIDAIAGSPYPKLNITYTKPQTATNNSLWQVKDNKGLTLTPDNLSIPSACWDYNATHLFFQVASKSTMDWHCSWSCYNGTAWQVVRIRSGDTTNRARCYEEAMYWDIPIGTAIGVSNGSVANVTWSGLTAHTTYYWYVNIDDGTYSVNSSVWNFESGNTEPNVTLNAPTDGATSQALNPTLNVTYIDDDSDVGNVTFYQNVSVGYCYQETANDTHVNDGSCSLSYGGVYEDNGYFEDGEINKPYYWRDGDWSTHSEDTDSSEPYPEANVTYVKPVGATNNSVWQVKDAGGTDNLTIPTACWEYNNTHLFFHIRANSGADRVMWSCYNSTAWFSLSNTVSVHERVFEEAMYWDIWQGSELGNNTGVSNGTIANITWSGRSQNTTYYWYVIVDDGYNTTTSDTWSFTTRQARAPSLTLVSPANGAVDRATSLNLQVNYTDPDNDPATLTFINNVTGATICTKNDVANGSTSTCSWSSLSVDTTYYWRVSANDSINITNSTVWSFTTAEATTGGGGGSSPPPDDPEDLGKVDCDVFVTPDSVSITNDVLAVALTVYNREDDSYSPSYSFRDVSGEMSITDYTRVGGDTGVIMPDSDALIEVSYKLPALGMVPVTGKAELVLTDTTCNDLIILVDMAVTESSYLGPLFEEGAPISETWGNIITEPLSKNLPWLRLWMLIMLYGALFGVILWDKTLVKTSESTNWFAKIISWLLLSGMAVLATVYILNFFIG